jgi:hypothetical protein
MHQCDTDLDDAVDRLWEVREAVLRTAELDPITEPIPFGGRDPQAALVNLAIYLGDLLARATAASGSDTATVVARAGEALSSPAHRPRRRLGERRSS